MSVSFEGGCHCGAVRYVCSEEPINVVNCHCGDCQQIAGSAFITGVLVPEGSVQVNGELNSYKVKADSGNFITRKFCPICGSRIIVELSGGIGVGVSYTTLDDNTWLEPKLEFYASEAQPWVNLCSSTEKLKGMN